jgi:hypothetical protein
MGIINPVKRAFLSLVILQMATAIAVAEPVDYAR